YTMSYSATYVARPTFVLDSYYAWTAVNFNAEPPRLDEKLGLENLGLTGTNGPNRLYGGGPQVRVDSFAAMRDPGSGGGEGPVVGQNRQKQFTANASWTKGSHNIRFGGDIVRQGLTRFETGASAGVFNFAGGPTAVLNGPSANLYNNFATFLL